MTSTELPTDWAQRPITDADILPGIIDLIVSERSRNEGAVHLLLCHADGHLLQPVAIHDVDLEEEAGAILEMFSSLFSGLHEQGVPAVVPVLARPGAAGRTPTDERFLGSFREAARESGLALLGLAVATPRGIVAVPLAGVEGDPETVDRLHESLSA